MMKKVLSFILIIAMLSNLSLAVFASSVNQPIDIQKSYKNGSDTVREGVIKLKIKDNNAQVSGNPGYGEVRFKETVGKDRVINELSYNGKKEKITTYLDKDIFTLEKDGKIETYKRSEFIGGSSRALAATYTPPGMGSNYTDRLVASQTFTYNGSKVARVKETYKWNPAEYNSWSFVAFTAVSLIVGVIGLGVSTVVAVLGSICTVIGGVMTITQAVTVEYNSYVQNWNKFMSVDGDRTHLFHYTAGRTKYSKFWAFSNGKVKTEVLSDKSTTYYYDNASILSTGIANYKAQH